MTYKLDFLGNLSRAAFAILASFKRVVEYVVHVSSFVSVHLKGSHEKKKVREREKRIKLVLL